MMQNRGNNSYPRAVARKTRTAAVFLASASALCAFGTAPPLAHAQRSSSAAKPSATARVVFGGYPLSFAPARAPFRDPADNALCVAPEALAPLGVTYLVDEKENRVTLMGPDNGATVTVSLRSAPSGSGLSGAFVPAVETLEGLGGKCQFNAQTNTLFVRSVLTSVEVLGGQLRIKATLPVTPRLTITNGRRQVIVDMPGSEVGTLPKTLNIIDPSVSAARSGQFADDTARVVLELRAPGGFTVLGGAGKPSTLIVMNPRTGAGAPGGSNAARRNDTVAAAPRTAPPSPAAAPSTTVTGASVTASGDDRVQIILSAMKAPDVRAELSRGRLTVDLLNASLGLGAAATLTGATHPFFSSVQLLARGDRASQLVIDLRRAVTYQVKLSPKGGLILELALPRSAGGRLAGKLVVVDPGHGAHDSGAAGVNGTYEKNVNLAIGTALADALRDAGANVILTRGNDSFIPVNERPRIANRAGADFFISVHSDSADRSHAVSGSTSYYHLNVPSSKALAQSIADRLADVGGIRSKGTRTDGIRFPGSGFGVLRGAKMVAVLIECGYMTNAGDVNRLNDRDFQQRTARAILAGLRDYIEGNPEDTRNANPEAGGFDPIANPNQDTFAPGGDNGDGGK